MDYRPAYMKIVDELQSEIEQGIYNPGDMIPTQLMLAERYGVSRITVRDAVNELIHRGLVYTKQGKGSFVASNVSNPYPAVRSGSFSGNNRTSASTVTTQVIKLEKITADQHLMHIFKLEKDASVICLSRIRSIDGNKTIFSTSYLDAQRFKQINFFEINFEKVSLYETLEKGAGLVVSESEEEFRAVPCPAHVAELLDFKAGDPVIHVNRKTFDDKGICFEWCNQYERTDRYAIRVRSKE